MDKDARIDSISRLLRREPPEILEAIETLLFGPLARKAKQRPNGFTQMSPQEQWAIDKELGILDWDGDPKK